MSKVLLVVAIISLLGSFGALLYVTHKVSKGCNCNKEDLVTVEDFERALAQMNNNGTE